MSKKQKDILFVVALVMALLVCITLLCCAADEVIETAAAVRYLWR